MPRTAKIILFAAICYIATGCATGYSQFYTSMPGATAEAIAATRVAPPPKSPPIHHAAGKFQDVEATYARRGFAVIGYSSFSSGSNESDKGAAQRATKVGADLVVIINPEYAGSVTSSVPITTPTSSTSYTNSTATAYGTGGSATAYGNSTTTTYGSNTTYIPMTVHRYEYGALYLVKRRFVLGAYFRDLEDQERRALQTNKGVYIFNIVDGSPAYESDLLIGDVIVALNGKPVNGNAGLQSLVESNKGSRVNLDIIRNGKPISKSVALGQ